jgi:hypothetical protein
VSTGGGFGSQNSLIQHVGLGQFAAADSINVFWPADKHRHRQIDHYYNVAADNIYYITENMNSEPDPSLLSLTPPQISQEVKIPPQMQTPVFYPNPATNVLNVLHLQPSVLKHFEIYDLLGRRQLDITGSENTFSLSVSNLKPGCYVLRITTNENTVTKQFIKE